MSLDLIPMLLLSLLLMTAGGDVTAVQLVLDGARNAAGDVGGLIVVDGRTTVPPGAQLSGPVHVLGGETRVRGTVDGDVVHISGRLVVEDGAHIGGTLRAIGGTLTVAPGAFIADRTSVELVPPDTGPLARIVPGLLLTAALALVAARRARRRPATLAHLRAAVERHPVVSLTVGGLVTVTFLSLFVFMAFTLVLIPVSLLGLAAGLVMVGYGIVALGAVAGGRLPIADPARANAAGVAAVVLTIQVLGVVPIIGSLAVGALLLTGLGAVLLTYVGLREFTPVALPD